MRSILILLLSFLLALTACKGEERAAPAPESSSRSTAIPAEVGDDTIPATEEPEASMEEGFVYADEEALEPEEEEVAGEPTYHEMEPVFVVNLPPGGRAKMLQVGLQVYTRDPTLVEALDRHDPMLRHHLFDILSAQQADDLFDRDGRARLQEALQDELKQQLEEAGVAKPRVDAIYFTQFVLQ